MRRDVLTGDWVSIAAARQNRALPAARRARSARPADADQPVRDPVALRRRPVFENKSPLLRPARSRVAHRRLPPAGRRSPAALERPRRASASAERARTRRPLRGRALQPRAPRTRSATLTGHARAHRDRGLGRPHRGPVGAARRRAGLPVREPRRGDRGHPRPPARPDLRLPLHHPRTDDPARWTDRARGRPICSRASSSSSSVGDRVVAARRALDRLRALRRPLAARGAPAAAPPGGRLRRDRRRPSATSSHRSTSACCAASTRCTTRPPRTSPRGTRPPCTSDATPCGCTCS